MLYKLILETEGIITLNLCYTNNIKQKTEVIKPQNPVQ